MADQTAIVRSHLEEVLASKSFANARRLRQFLRFIVEKALAGEGNELKEYVIASDVYERGPDYNPQVDSTVRVEASRLRAKLAVYYGNTNIENQVRIELPKGSYVPIFHTAGEKASRPASREQVHAVYSIVLAIVVAMLLWSAHVPAEMPGYAARIAAADR